MGDFKISALLGPHPRGVRAVGFIDDDHLATADESGRLFLWTRSEDKKSFTQSTPFGSTKLHGDRIILSVQPFPLLEEKAYISLGGDSKAKVWNAEGKVLSEFTGHTQAVESAAFTEGGLMVTGSWDGSFKLWRDGTCIQTVKDQDHKFRVNVCYLPESKTLVTSSGNANIVLYSKQEGDEFKRGRVIQRAHGDSLRGVTAGANGGFITFSNDGTARLWSSTGDAMGTCRACDSAIAYCAAVLPKSGEVVAGGEPKTCKIFSPEGKQTQELPHTGALLSVTVLPNGDILTGCGGSNTFARVWTRSPSRQSPDLAVPEAKAASSSSGEGGGGGGGLDLNNLPGAEVLQQPGKKDGAVVIAKVDGTPSVYQWSETEYQWDYVGEAMAGPPKPVKKFDFDVKVDLGQGPGLQLQFNRGADPFQVAIDFVNKHSLEPFDIPTIENYVRQLLR